MAITRQTSGNAKISHPWEARYTYHTLYYAEKIAFNWHSNTGYGGKKVPHFL